MKKYIPLLIALFVILAFNFVLSQKAIEEHKKIISAQEELIADQREMILRLHKGHSEYVRYCDSLIDRHDSLYNELIDGMWNKRFDTK